MPLDNVLRADEVQPSIGNDEALANAPKTAKVCSWCLRSSNDAARTHPQRVDGQARGGESPPVRPCRRVSAIDAVDGSINAFMSIDRDDALGRGRRRRALGQGLDHADSLCSAYRFRSRTFFASDQPANCSSKFSATPFTLRRYSRSKTSRGRAVIFGRVAWTSSPWAARRKTRRLARPATRGMPACAGGSSGGCAAAVSAQECFGSIGTDTGGSIRQPAALCGCVGIKPTYGRVSRYGVVAFASSLDQVGPMGKTVRDTATLLDAIAGHDPRDSTSVPADVPDYAAGLEGTSRASNWACRRSTSARASTPRCALRLRRR